MSLGSVAMITDCPNMIIAVDGGHKAPIQTITSLILDKIRGIIVKFLTDMADDNNCYAMLQSDFYVCIPAPQTS